MGLIFFFFCVDSGTKVLTEVIFHSIRSNELQGEMKFHVVLKKHFSVTNFFFKKCLYKRGEVIVFPEPINLQEYQHVTDNGNERL